MSYDPQWTIHIGATARRNFAIQSRDADNALSAVDITGATFTCKLRSMLSSGTVVATPTGSIVTAASGTMKIELDETVTADLDPGSGVWDLSMTLSGDVTVVAEGTYRIVQRSSR